MSVQAAVKSHKDNYHIKVIWCYTHGIMELNNLILFQSLYQIYGFIIMYNPGEVWLFY